MSNILTKENIRQAYDGAYYTILGAGGDLNEWFEGYQGLLDEAEIGKITEWYQTTGKVVNEYYGLKGKDKFPKDLTILMFPLKDLDIGKLAMFKLRMGDRWFNDVIDNATNHYII